MEVSYRRQWVKLIVFTVSATLMFAGVGWGVQGWIHPQKDVADYAAGAFLFFTDWDEKQYTKTDESTVQMAAAGTKLIKIPINEQRRIGRAVLIYRGVEKGSHIRLDVIIPELDPQSAYPYTFRIKIAKKGFRLADTTFRLVSARKNAVYLNKLE